MISYTRSLPADSHVFALYMSFCTKFRKITLTLSYAAFMGQIAADIQQISKHPKMIYACHSQNSRFFCHITTVLNISAYSEQFLPFRFNKYSTLTACQSHLLYVCIFFQKNDILRCQNIFSAKWSKMTYIKRVAGNKLYIV